MEKNVIKIGRFLIIGMLALSAGSTHVQAARRIDEALTQVPYHKVEVRDRFWLPRLVVQRDSLLPFAFENNKPAIENLRKTADFLKGKKDDLPFPHRYIVSDLYKVMEGAAYLLKLRPDRELESYMDSIIDFIAGAQAPDGYHYEAHVAGVATPESETGMSPYSYVAHSHELYNMGHLYEAAVAYYQATGKRKLLDVAEKNAKHINHVFFEGDSNYNNGKPVNQAPGHEEIELALVKLGEVTGNDLYINMAKRFIDIRGVTFVPEGKDLMEASYAQQHAPVRKQRKAVGHAVRAMYLYTAMADVSRMTGDRSLQPALRSIWHNIVDTRMHITGGLGAVRGIEGFGDEYDLPNKNTYDETCAGIGNVLFNQRMFLMSREAKYLDVAEVALYNNVLAGVNLNGNRFFYVNPLETDGIEGFNQGSRSRFQWFGTACCPSNIARILPQVSGMMYALQKNTLYCCLYGGNRAELELDNGALEIEQVTRYPFGESIVLKMFPQAGSMEFELKMRIPTWLSDRFVPGDLYYYLDKENNSSYTLKVNDKIVKAKVKDGFVTVKRTWETNDKVELILPQPLRYSAAIDKVEADRDRVCLTQGPLVYCAEGVDNRGLYPNVVVDAIGKQPTGTKTDYPSLKGIYQLILPARVKTADGIEDCKLSLIPYYAWNNRGVGSMQVWFSRNADKFPFVNSAENYLARFQSLKTSHTWRDDQVEAIFDCVQPTSSYEPHKARWTSWPQVGKPQWIELELKKPITFTSLGVFWYDDGDKGGVHVPQSWQLKCKIDGEWIDFPHYEMESYTVLKDRFNTIHTEQPLTVEALRIEITAEEKSAVGILEVDIREK